MEIVGGTDVMEIVGGTNVMDGVGVTRDEDINAKVGGVV